jgi:hypothetical protein
MSSCEPSWSRSAINTAEIENGSNSKLPHVILRKLSLNTVCAKIYSTEMKRRARVSVLYILAHTVLTAKYDQIKYTVPWMTEGFL